MTEPDFVLDLASGRKIRLYGGAVTPQTEGEQPSCETCRFFQASLDGGPQGQCRRHAPFPNSLNTWGRDWPPVNLTDWCGEYEKQTN